MLPLAHTYINHKLSGSKDPLLILGGVLPDISTASGEKLPRDLLHNNPVRFYTFVAKKYPELLPLALGARLHSQVDHGADYYSDNHLTGYAYLLGLKIAPEVADLLGRKMDEVSTVLAHNFIEGGIDLNLAKKQPLIYQLYFESRGNFDRQAVEQCLAEYFSVPRDIAARSLEKLLRFLKPENYLSVEAAVTGALQPLVKIRLKRDLDYVKAGKLLTKAVVLTFPSYLEFLDATIEKMRRDFAKYLPKHNA